MKILSWNINGIRAAYKKGLIDWMQALSPDILALQETKASPDQLQDELLMPPGYFAIFNSAEKKGYSGVALYSKTEPLNVIKGLGIPEFDTEGRVLGAEYNDFILLNIYFPNGKKDETRLKYKLDFYNAFLNKAEELISKGKTLIVCGDVNTAHNEIDLARPKENENSSGFLREERDWLDKFQSSGLIDTFRALHPEKIQYSWWDLKTGARARNVGWRIDYFYIDKKSIGRLKDAFIMNEVEGSDHCPVGIEIE